jgi:APA family basic amino acid/polyamine antiporter
MGASELPTNVAISPSLQRALGRLDVVALTLNNVVGAGIFALPAALAAAAGRFSLPVLLAAFVLVSLMALCTVEVASRYNVTGGPMYYAKDAFGPTAGFIIGWLMYLSRLSAFGAVASVMLDYAAGLWPALATQTARVIAVALFIATIAAFNLRGVKYGALLSNLLTLSKGLPLVVLALAGLWLGGFTAGAPGATPDVAGLSRGVLIAFFACMGFEQAAVVAGEVRDPRRDIPVGILGGLAVVGVLYALLMLACFAAVPDLAHSKRPLADAAARIFGPAGSTAMSVTATISCAGALAQWMIVSPRVLYSLAEQGDMPRALARIDPVRLTPALAILASALVVWILTVSGTFVYLATFSVIARMLMYASTCVALVTLRRRDGPAPLTIPAGPVLALIAVISCVVVLATTTGTALRDISIALAVGWTVRLGVRHQR